MNIIGIDPGLNGGIAIIPFYDFKRTVVYSLADYSLSQLAILFQEFRGGGGVLHEQEKDTHCEVYLEEPQLPMLNSHNSNNFSVQAHKKLARSLGQLEGICIAAGYPPNLVSPRKWQGFLSCNTKGDKNLTKNLAIKCFPFLNRECKSGKNKGLPVSTITHAVADALLIALYGYLQYQNPQRIPLTVSNSIPSILPGRKKPPVPAPGVPIGTTKYVFDKETGDMRLTLDPNPQEISHDLPRPKRPPVPARYGPHRPRADR